MNEEEEIKSLDYLVDVTERLLDTQEVIENIVDLVNADKTNLIKAGQDFRYQQGILDIVAELDNFVHGKSNLRSMRKQITTQVEAMRDRMQEVNPMDAV